MCIIKERTYIAVSLTTIRTVSLTTITNTLHSHYRALHYRAPWNQSVPQSSSVNSIPLIVALKDFLTNSVPGLFGS